MRKLTALCEKNYYYNANMLPIVSGSLLRVSKITYKNFVNH
jgi:hypothetical protein